MLFRVADYHWEHPELEKHMKAFSEGDFLFRQGEPGTTMFILVRGVVGLLARRDGKDYLLEVLQAGEFLGEKAVMSSQPHERFFSAQARTPLLVCEMGLPEIEGIQRRVPALMTDLLKRMFQIAASRLDHANQVVGALRSRDNVERFLRLVLLMARAGRPTPFGREIFLNLDKIRYYVDMTLYEIQQCVATLEKRNVLIPQGESSYILRSERALLDAARAIADDLPNLKAI